MYRTGERSSDECRVDARVLLMSEGVCRNSERRSAYLKAAKVETPLELRGKSAKVSGFLSNEVVD